MILQMSNSPELEKDRCRRQLLNSRPTGHPGGRGNWCLRILSSPEKDKPLRIPSSNKDRHTLIRVQILVFVYEEVANPQIGCDSVLKIYTYCSSPLKKKFPSMAAFSSLSLP